MFSGLPGDQAGEADAGEPQDRLSRLAYVTLPPSLDRRRRAGVARAIARRALGDDRSYPKARAWTITQVLRAGSGRTGIAGLVRAHRSAEATENHSSHAEQQLAALAPAARAACALRHLDGMDNQEIRELLAAAYVHDPETAIAVANHAPLDAEGLRAIEVPLRRPVGRTRLVAAGAAAVVLGVAAPVIAATAGGGDTGTETTPTVQPAGMTSEVEVPAGAGPGAGEAADQPADAGQSAPAPADPALQTGQAKVAGDLDRILQRLDIQIAQQGSAGPELEKLLGLRAAVVAQQDKLRR